MTPRHFRTALAATLALGLLASGCSKRETRAEEGIRTQTLLVGNAAEPLDLDPHVIVAFTDSNIAYALFEGMTKLAGPDSHPVPAGAESWDVSGDGLTYTFHLRRGARWSDGDPVTSDDYVYSFHRILTPAFGALYSYMLWPIKNAEAFNDGKISDFSLVGAKALDPYTLRLDLERPTPFLPALASHTTWLPVHKPVIERFGRMDEKGTKWTRVGNFVGNGAFTLTEWIPNGRIAVEKSPTYWDAANVRLHRIEFYPFEKSEVEELNYRSGQLHVTYQLPVSKVEGYRSHVPKDLREDQVLSSFYLFVNVTRPPFDNVKLRLALAHAVSRDAIARDVSKGVYPAWHGLVPPNCGGYTCRAGITDDFDLARRLLAEAGYPGGKGLEPFEVQCYESEVSLRTLEAVQQTWLKELGVHMTIAQLEQKTLFQNQQEKNYSVAFSAWIADYPDPLTFLGFMVTGNGNNWSGWSNLEYDRLIAQSSDTADNAKRLEIFQKAEALMLSEAPIIPLSTQLQVNALNPAVKGWTTTLVGFHDWNKMWLER
jgi:oligopeptide transport system substrate-binding protein